VQRLYGLRPRASFLLRNGALAPGAESAGTVAFGDVSVIGVEVRTHDGNAPQLYLQYRTGTSPHGEVADMVTLTATRPQFGGVRYWFRCPGPSCGRRVGVLYLPPGETHFLCRHCHGLTYSTQQNGHRYRAFYAWATALRE
jgi:hypothetical protein